MVCSITEQDSDREEIRRSSPPARKVCIESSDSEEEEKPKHKWVDWNKYVPYIINSRIKWLINLNLTIWFIPFKCVLTITEITTLIIIYQLSKKNLLFKQIRNTFILVVVCILQKKKKILCFSFALFICVVLT